MAKSANAFFAGLYSPEKTDALVVQFSSVFTFFLDFPFEFLCAWIYLALYIFLMPAKVPEGKLRNREAKS